MNREIAVDNHLDLHGNIDPDLKQMLEDDAAAGNPPTETLPLDEARQGHDDFAGVLMEKAPEAGCARIDDVQAVYSLGQAEISVPLRVYIPEKHTGMTAGAGMPVMVFIHGGGWIFAAMEAVDKNCRLLSNRLEALIVSVDYRLAPEHPFPAAAEDCYAAVKWVSENIEQYGGNRERISVCGDSAGGNLSAVVSIMARDRSGPDIAAQILQYPVIDLYSLKTRSYSDYAEGYLLTKNVMQWLIDLYVPDQDMQQDPYASPLWAEDVSGLPPALVISAEFDPLRDEAFVYARKLREAGVQSEYACYTGMLHGFFYMAYFCEGAGRACDDLYGRMKTLIHGV